MVNDSGANVKAAIKLMDNNIIKLPCAAHRLNLVVGDILKVKNIIRRKKVTAIFDYNEDDCLRLLPIDETKVEEIEALNDIKESVESIIKKCKHLVGSFNSSEQLNRRLKEKQIELNVGHSRKLVQDVITRWNSTHDMLKSILDNKQPLRALQVYHILNNKS